LYRRVVAYVVRDGALLVFDHRDVPQAGTQFPAGTVEDGEEPAAAVVREVLEECGVRTRVVRELGTTDAIAPRGEPRRNYFFELTTDDARDKWEHVVAGGGGDDGMVFVCRFVPREGLPQLAGDDDFLDEL
jgi:8-oxo-dGTP pyrophosphatase MutT (NUDIX family)